MTSDERQEAARRLREIKPDERLYGYVQSETVFNECGIDGDFGCVLADDLGRLADLIDPTTTVDETGVETVVDAVHLCECNECGHSFEWVYGEYEYCPRCGARVVRPNGY